MQCYCASGEFSSWWAVKTLTGLVLCAQMRRATIPEEAAPARTAVASRATPGTARRGFFCWPLIPRVADDALLPLAPFRGSLSLSSRSLSLCPRIGTHFPAVRLRLTASAPFVSFLSSISAFVLCFVSFHRQGGCRQPRWKRLRALPA